MGIPVGIPVGTPVGIPVGISADLSDLEVIPVCSKISVLPFARKVMEPLKTLPLNINGGSPMNEDEEEEVVVDMDVIEDLCDRHDIRRNQRISTLMDAIDEAAEDAPDDGDEE